MMEYAAPVAMVLIPAITVLLLCAMYRWGYARGQYDEQERWVQSNDGPSQQTVDAQRCEIEWLRSRLLAISAD